jgi:hypothetical protein
LTFDGAFVLGLLKASIEIDCACGQIGFRRDASGRADDRADSQ